MAKINYWQSYQSQGFYHIYNHGSADKNIFIDMYDYEDFLGKFNKYFSSFFEIYAFCLMPNHFHFIVKVKDEVTVQKDILNNVDSNAKTKYLAKENTLNELIEDQWRRFLSSYSLKYNNKYKTKGQLFLNRHKRVGFNKELRLEYLICYVHHNPIHHKFRRNYNLWQHSSYNSILKGNDELIDIKNILDFFGNKEEYLKAHSKFKIYKENELNMD